MVGQMSIRDHYKISCVFSKGDLFLGIWYNGEG